MRDQYFPLAADAVIIHSETAVLEKFPLIREVYGHVFKQLFTFTIFQDSQDLFIMEANTMNPDQTAPLGAV